MRVWGFGVQGLGCRALGLGLRFRRHHPLFNLAKALQGDRFRNVFRFNYGVGSCSLGLGLGFRAAATSR